MEWKISQELIDYPLAVSGMEERVGAIISGTAPEMIWLLEHPPLYTSGTSANALDLLDESRFPVYASGRGGQYTYHGPGQRIAYVMLDLKKRAEPRSPDIRAYVGQLEQWIINSLAHFGVTGNVRDGRVGVWTLDKHGNESKIAALGIRVRKWVTYHGISLNVHPDLSHYAGIVPCGINNFGVTSLHALGVNVTLAEVDVILRREFEKLFAN